MGWASGTEVARQMIEAIKRNVTDRKAKRNLYVSLLDALESQDWDTLEEAEGIDPDFDKIVQKRYE